MSNKFILTASAFVLSTSMGIADVPKVSVDIAVPTKSLDANDKSMFDMITPEENTSTEQTQNIE